MRRYIFKKWDKTKETTKCWNCQNKTLFFILDKKKGEEFFCCRECALKKYKIKRLRGLLKKYPIRKEKTSSEPNSLIKKEENSHMGEGSEPQIPLNTGGKK